MKLQEAIAQIDNLKPNSYSDIEKTRWISTLDGIVKKEIIDTHEDDEGIVFNGYDEETSLDTKLLVPDPYS